MVSSVSLTFLVRYICLLFSFSFSSSSYWRIKSQLHTTKQIIAGGILGSTSATLSIHTQESVIHRLGPLIALEQQLQLPIIFMVKLALAALAGIVIFSRDIKHLIRTLKDDKKAV